MFKFSYLIENQQQVFQLSVQITCNNRTEGAGLKMSGIYSTLNLYLYFNLNSATLMFHSLPLWNNGFCWPAELTKVQFLIIKQD